MSIQINDVNVIDDDRNVSAAGIVTVGTGNSATIIDGTTGITSVGIGITMEGVPGNISIAGTITAAGFNVSPTPVSFSPTDGATDQLGATNIEITFDQYITGFATDKNITLRDSSGIGTVLQTIAADSGAVSVNGATVTINPPSDLPNSTNVYVVVDEGAFLGAYSAPSTLIDTYNFTTENVPPLGGAYGGGYLICCSGGTLWVVAPSSTQVSRNWYSRNDAVTTANANAACGDWFVPSIGQLQNPGYTCRTYWDSYCTVYWSNTELNSCHAQLVIFSNACTTYDRKQDTHCVRSFRCVTY